MGLFSLWLIAACSGNKESSDPSSDSGSVDSGTTTPDVNPEILALDLSNCQTIPDSNPAADSWTFQLTVNDPQGSDSVRSGTADAKDLDTIVWTFDLSCRNGVCITSTRSTNDGITCAFAGTFEFKVSDEQGNPSEVWVYNTQQ